MKTLFLTLALLFASHQMYAENRDHNSTVIADFAQGYDAQEIPAQQGPQPVNFPKWSLETSLTFPAARIYMLKASVRVSESSELGFGPAFQNWKNKDESPLGQANAYTLLLSYRHYFWRNFHVELELWPAYNHFKSFVDGKTYKGLELWVEYKLGYKANLTNNLYINIQPGLANGLWLQNKWPDSKDETYFDFVKNSLVFVPQVLVGWTF